MLTAHETVRVASVAASRGSRCFRARTAHRTTFRVPHSLLRSGIEPRSGLPQPGPSQLVLDDSLSSHGLQKSDEIREREAQKPVSGAEASSEVPNPSDGFESAESPQRRYRRQNGWQRATERGSRERRVGVSTTDEWWRKTTWHRNNALRTRWRISMRGHFGERTPPPRNR